MPHETYILAAYGFAFLALGWCALAPWLRGRRLLRELRRALNRVEDSHAHRS